MSTLLHNTQLLLLLVGTTCTVVGAFSENLDDNSSDVFNESLLEIKSSKLEIENIMEKLIVMNSKLDNQVKEQQELKEDVNKTRVLTDVLKMQLDKLIHDLLARDSCLKSPGMPGTQDEPRDCSDIRDMGFSVSGVYQVHPRSNIKAIEADVYCDFNSFNESWLVFQRRNDGNENFERLYSDYEKGFGNLSGEFWLGNDILSFLTMNRDYKLRIEMEDFEGEKRYAEYLIFSVKPATDKYRLTVAEYSGNAGDSLSYHSGMQFSTKDADNDANEGNCAQDYHGAWWYNHCHVSNLNGVYRRSSHTPYANGIIWVSWHGHYYSLKTTEMKIAAFS